MVVWCRGLAGKAILPKALCCQTCGLTAVCAAPDPASPRSCSCCSLVTHEPHFCLLREVVSFTGGGRGQPAKEVLDNPCQEHFVLLQIG